MKRTSSLSALVVMTVLGLVLGSIGTAVAGPGLTKGAAKKIAVKVVKKAAPSLAVAHASSATTSGDAANLGGQPPSAYLDRVAQSLVPVASFAYLMLSDLDAKITTVTVTVPTGVHFVHVTSTLNVEMAAGKQVAVWISAEPTSCPHSGVGWDNRTVGSNAGSSIQMQLVDDLVLPVTPGAHTYALCARPTAAGGSYFQAALTAETVAGNATGGTS